jgi:hypothetical protein
VSRINTETVSIDHLTGDHLTGPERRKSALKVGQPVGAGALILDIVILHSRTEYKPILIDARKSSAT